LWILSKRGESNKKIVLTVKQKLEFEKSENIDLATELAKDYGVGIE
jgi:hypothetical protein